MVDLSPDTVVARYEEPTAEQLRSAEAVVQQFASNWAHPSADDLLDMMHPDTQNLIPPMTRPGNAQDVVEHFRGVLERLPDLRIHVIRWAPTGDAVMIEWQASATVAGKPLEWTGVDRFNIREGRMYEGRVYWDTRGLETRMMAAVQEAQTAA